MVSKIGRKDTIALTIIFCTQVFINVKTFVFFFFLYFIKYWNGQF